jgi:hypothetical protein
MLTPSKSPTKEISISSSSVLHDRAVSAIATDTDAEGISNPINATDSSKDPMQKK